MDRLSKALFASLFNFFKMKIIQKTSSVFNIIPPFSFRFANLGEQKKVARDDQEVSRRNNQSRNSTVIIINEENFIQISEEIEDRVTKKLTQEFSGTESRVLVSLDMFDELLLNPQVRVQTRIVPGTSWNMNVENQKPSEDRSQKDFHPEIAAFVYQLTQSKD